MNVLYLYMEIRKKSKISMNGGSRRTIIPNAIADLLDINANTEVTWILNLADNSLKVELTMNERGE